MPPDQRAAFRVTGEFEGAPRTVEFAGGDLTALPSLLAPLHQIIETHATLYDWAAAMPQPMALRGRAPVYVAALDGGERVVVRHAWHGGLLAPLTGDRFRRPTRAPREMQQSAALRDAGIPTTQIVGFARYDAGFGCARVDVVSRFVDGAMDLGMVLSGLGHDLSGDEAFDAVLDLLVRLAHAGVVHPDLNVKNILLRRSGRGHVDALVIDIDVIDWDPARPSVQTMSRNVERLVRSIRKWRRQFGCAVTDTQLVQWTTTAMARA
ncbi:MAG: hypothetical protein RLZZ621_59 [Gemmatimonadota bacterium]